jgi:phospholipase/carboxylesterase
MQAAKLWLDANDLLDIDEEPEWPASMMYGHDHDHDHDEHDHHHHGEEHHHDHDHGDEVQALPED